MGLNKGHEPVFKVTLSNPKKIFTNLEKLSLKIRAKFVFGWNSIQGLYWVSWQLRVMNCILFKSC